MNAQNVDMFLMTNAKFFEPHQLGFIREKLLAMDDSKWISIQALQLHDPTMILIVSLFAGSLGVDRFILGDTGLGVLKLLTCGGFGIWTIIDWFTIMGLTRQKNMEKFQMYLGY
ncbi:MAG: hypothetical protein A2W93_06580 [Bacteroidetes bacterium GWF2_43_63]|nr:MAG: hypothetical protein A2W94_07955 [Bacteroidetes bacterium GWE2_42_42]OFY53285.1 MAG: hypothetical protein A2W93_06580 [Bacteroidetes bacterium GWF2_43_63]HBG71721.1 hypothetical protein [Bacteroidales bacterium]HCB61614.1 hypothetical protein [Bacteroidales bacterium]HCY22826.1 hypothetical protein [Bacteroidales bacterium]